MLSKLELHIHTIYSKDSLLPGWLLLLMCKIKKIKTIAITDHNEIRGAQKYAKKFKKHGIRVIVGEEIFSSEGEIIGLFLTNLIPAGLSAKETIQEIKKQSGIVYIPHPYDEKRYKTVIAKTALEENVNDIDMIEAYNGRNISTTFGEKQSQICTKYKKTKVVGSDAHTFYELGRNYCLIEDFTKENFANKIKSATFCTKKCLNIAHFETKVARVLKGRR